MLEFFLFYFNFFIIGQKKFKITSSLFIFSSIFVVARQSPLTPWAVIHISSIGCRSWPPPFFFLPTLQSWASMYVSIIAHGSKKTHIFFWSGSRCTVVYETIHTKTHTHTAAWRGKMEQSVQSHKTKIHLSAVIYTLIRVFTHLYCNTDNE